MKKSYPRNKKGWAFDELGYKPPSRLTPNQKRELHEWIIERYGVLHLRKLMEEGKKQ